jgi:NADH-quinone oxidoreductase subunit N
MENLVEIALQNVNMAAILPSLVLTCFGMGLLLINVFLPRGTTRSSSIPVGEILNMVLTMLLQMIIMLPFSA